MYHHSNQLKVKIEWETVDVMEMFEEMKGGEEFIEMTNPTQIFLERYPDKGIFHVLHCNRSLSKVLLQKMSMVDGVERLIPLSRYRAVINIGKLFSETNDDIYSVKNSLKRIIDQWFYPEKYQQVAENPAEEKSPGV